MKKNFLFISIIFSAALFLTSCEFFNQSVKYHLEYYTETVGVEKMTLSCPTRTDGAGNICIPSDSDVTFTFYLRNPYDITELEINYDLDDNSVCTDDIPIYYLTTDTHTNGGKGTMADSKTICLTMSSSDLMKYEETYIQDSETEKSLHRDISGNIDVRRTDISQEKGDEFSIEKYLGSKLYVNSPPPAIKNPVLQTSEDGSGNYILCFYMPNLTGTVHAKDTHNFSINATENGKTISKKNWYINGDGKFYTDKDYTSEDKYYNSETEAPTLYPLSDGYEFKKNDDIINSGYTVCYYDTGVEYTTNEVKFNLKIQDDAGLSESIGVSNHGYQLEPPIMQIESGGKYVDFSEEGSYLASDDNGTAKIQFTHSGKTKANPSTECGAVQVEYTITKSDGSTYKTGTVTVSSSKPAVVEVPAGKNYSITATAKKDYYIASDATSVENITISRSGNYYVSKNGSASYNGSKNNPFRTVQQAVDDIYKNDTGTYTINLLSDITPDESDLDKDGYFKNNRCLIQLINNYNITLNGNGYTIDGKRTTDNKGRIISYTSGLLTLKDITITGAVTGKVSEGKTISGAVVCSNTITVTGKVFICDNYYDTDKSKNNVLLDGSSVVNAANLDKDSSIGISIIPSRAPKYNNPVAFATGLSSSIAPSSVFFSDAGYAVGWTDSTTKKGASLYVNTPTIGISNPIKNVTITVNNSIIAKKSGSTKDSRTVTASANIVENNTSTDITDYCSWSMELLCHGDSVYCTSTKNTIIIPDSLLEDTYTLYIKAVYGGVTYSASQEIVVYAE